MSYYDYMREHVFTPAGMDSSDFYTRTEWNEGRRFAHPYAARGPGDRVDVLDAYPLVGTPGGGAFASAPDLARFADALHDGTTLLDHASAYLVSSPKLPLSADGNARFAAYGTTAHCTNGQWSNAKNGGSMGVSCNVEWFPESDWVAVVLSNYADIAASVSDKVRELIAGEPISGRECSDEF